MLSISKIEMITSNGIYEAYQNNNIFSYDDLEVHIENDFSIKISGGVTELKYVNIEFNFLLSAKVLVLGDTWERAYGDLRWKKPDNMPMPWYFIAKDNDKIYAFGVETQPDALCFWKCSGNKILLTIDVRNGSLPLQLNGRTLNACTVVSEEYNSDTYLSIHSFCKKMCKNPRLPDRAVYGGNDWYCNYGNNSYEKILKHTRRVVECSPKNAPKPYMVIDDGWEICHHQSADDNEYFNGGPWKYCNNNFGDMQKVAEKIEKIGAIPGIWFRPLWTTEKVPEEWVLRKNGIKLTLDPSVPAVLEKVKEDTKCLVDWGYKLIKHDFSSFDIFGQWGFEMTEELFKNETVFANKTKTTAEIIKNFYQVIRDAVGDDVLIMGCNTMSHLSAGVFDIQRTGDDTSGLDFERTKKYGINTLAFRMCQHNAFYAVDADCVGITKHIGWEKNRQWLDLLSKSGTPLFVSIAEDCYTDEIKKDIAFAMERASKMVQPSKPVDWLETRMPRMWESVYGTDEYNW